MERPKPLSAVDTLPTTGFSALVGSTSLPPAGPSGLASELRSDDWHQRFVPPEQGLEPSGRESLTNEAYGELSRRAPVSGLRETLAPGRGPDRAALVELVDGVARSYRIVPEGGLRVGRSPDADLHLDDEGASLFSASIQFEGRAGFVLYALDGERPATVDGARVTRWVLQDGDVLRFGPKSELRFSLIDGREEKILRQQCATQTAEVHHLDPRRAHRWVS